MLENCKISGFADEIDASFDKQLEVLSELGQKYIELRGADGIGVADISMEKAAELKAKMEKCGVKVSAIGSPIGKIGLDGDFEAHFKKYQHIVELAKFFETPYIRMFSFYLPDENQPEAYREQVFAWMQKLVDYAKQENVILMHENEKGIYGAKAAQCLDLFQTFYGEHFQGIFDFANFVQCRQDTLEAYGMLKEYIRYFHVKDAVWENGSVVPAGMGNGYLQKIFRQAQENGFAGYLSLEPHLSDFTGFAALEKESEQKNQKSEMNGVRAYRVAHESLVKLLQM